MNFQFFQHSSVKGTNLTARVSSHTGMMLMMLMMMMNFQTFCTVSACLDAASIYLDMIRPKE
jgi:hypothetical protein